MSGQFGQPTEGVMSDQLSFLRYAASAQRVQGGPRQTTASMAGVPQYAATSFTMSDILQGTFALNNQSDTLLVVNKGLTQDLDGLYSLGVDGVSSFSTSPAAPSLISGSTSISNPNGGSASNATTGSGSNVGFTPTGEVDEAWVASLPLEHPSTKALLWVRKGKASREMHIPTSDDIATDIAQHKQYAGLKSEWKHPYNMDRVGGWIGGENFIPGPLDTGTIGGEDPGIAGQHGAFGIMDPTEEQFYCSMAWPFDGTGVANAFQKAGRQDIIDKVKGITKDAYRGKRVLVYSTQTKKAVVCCPGDWGPNPYFSNGATAKSSIQGFYIGLAPDVHFALGTDHGAEVQLGWVSDLTPVGPYEYNPSAGTSGGGVSDTTGVSAGGGQNTIEELIYAGQLIIAHPNCWIASRGNYTKQVKALFTTGVTSGVPSEVLYKGSDGKQFLFPSLLNYIWYILEGGFIIDNYLGAIGHKMAAGNAARLSNHATGGAIDIGNIGLASEGVTYGYSNANWRRVMDNLFGYLDSLPANTRGEEIGCSFACDYPNGLHIYKDAHPTHLHLGFDLTEAGTLIRSLKKKAIATGPVRVAV